MAGERIMRTWMRKAVLAIACAVAVLCVGGISPMHALAQTIEMPVSLYCDSVVPLERLSYTGEGKLITIEQGANLTMRALFKGGEGEMAHSWSVSEDGGVNYEPLDEESNEYLIANAQPLPESVDYVYRLYTYDSSIQRVESLFTVHVNPAKPDPGPDPEPDPDPIDNPKRPDAGRPTVRTGDELPNAWFIGAGIVVSASFMVYARRRQHDDVSEG